MRIKKFNTGKIFLFVVNDPSYFVSHRLPIGIELINRGYKVYLASMGECPSIVSDSGIKYRRIPINRKGKNLFSEALTLLSLVHLFYIIKPDIVHLVTIKPYLYGGIAARLIKIPSVISAVAGLGIAFSENSLKSKILLNLLFPVFKFSFSHKNMKAIFQNSNDKEVLAKWGVLKRERAEIIRGAGVKIIDYPFILEPSHVPVIVMASRLLRDKGVVEFVEASALLKKRGVEAIFWLIGDIDSGNNNTVTLEDINFWEGQGLIKAFGFREDVAHLFSMSNIIALPSFYGEGLPKVLIEAAACGRAVVTTDHPGCRDAIEPNITGLLVPIKNSIALADAFEKLIKNPELRHEMGRAGRTLAEREFTVEKVVARHLEIYDELVVNEKK